MQDQSGRKETKIHPEFNPYEIKIEQMLADEVVGDILPGLFRPGSSQAPKRRELADEVVDDVLLRAFGSCSSRAKKGRSTKRRASRKVS